MSALGTRDGGGLGRAQLRGRSAFSRSQPRVLRPPEPTLAALPPLEWLDGVDTWLAPGGLFGVAYGMLVAAHEMIDCRDAIAAMRDVGLAPGTRVDVHAFSEAGARSSELFVTIIGEQLPAQAALDPVDDLLAQFGAVHLGRFEHLSFHARLTAMLARPPAPSDLRGD